MILGIGIDITDTRRIEATLKKFGARFVNKVFTAGEQVYAKKRRATAFAGRFAAKEACAKALGTGIAKTISWQDIEVVHTREGAPELALTGGAEKRLKAMTPKGKKARVHVTLAHEADYAIAQVMIEAL